jgi:hypothetical protein
MGYAVAADAIVALHVAYVGFVVLGLLAVLVGAALGWGWVRNLWFRLAHLTAIGLVALEAVFGIACPLTVWEGSLRRLAGRDAGEGTFVGRFLHALIFYEIPPWFEAALHIGFAVLVLATFVLVPPRRKAGAASEQVRPAQGALRASP